MAISTAIGSAGAVPIGVVNPFAGATAPSGWLLCFGQAVSRSQYSALFAVLNTTYGAGDGSTTFTLPDMRGRAVAGKDDMGGSTAGRITAAVTGVSGTTLGNAGGDQRVHAHSHANTASFSGNAASHTHIQNAHEHNLYFQGSIGGNRYMIGDYLGGAGPSYFIPSMSTVTASAVSGYSIAQGVTPTNQSTSITPTGSVTVTNATFPVSGTAVSQNLPPTIILNYIIKAQ